MSALSRACWVGLTGYSMRVDGVPKVEGAARRLLTVVPPGCAAASKHVFAVMHGAEPIGLVDVIDGYPDASVAFVGLLAIGKDRQHRSLGRSGAILGAEAKALERGGADPPLLATNTMHKVADEMMVGMKIPLLHIATSTADRIREAGFNAPGLMAISFTMEQEFYTGKLRAAGLKPILPDAADRAETHRIIYEELCKDIATPESRLIDEGIAKRLAADGADCLILGCTEIGMLLDEGNVPIPVFDTTQIHCETALEMALLL